MGFDVKKTVVESFTDCNVQWPFQEPKSPHPEIPIEMLRLHENSHGFSSNFLIAIPSESTLIGFYHWKK